MKTININDIKTMGQINIIDIREPNEINGQMVDGAKNIPMMGLIMNASSFLNKDETYYLYCQGGGRSFNACTYLENDGYKVVNLDGGFSSYIK